MGKRIIEYVHDVEGHGIALGRGWIKYANGFKFLFIFPILFQLAWMDIRIREVRKQLGFKETQLPLWKRFLQFWKWWSSAERLWWELTAKKKDPTLHFVIGHYHHGDKLLLDLVQWLLRPFRTRVKIYITAGRWVSLSRPLHLQCTHIEPNGSISKINIEEVIPLKTISNNGESFPPSSRFVPQPRLDFSL